MRDTPEKLLEGKGGIRRITCGRIILVIVVLSERLFTELSHGAVRKCNEKNCKQ